MRLADFNRLKKLMSMTTSDNDTEALGAIRAANKILAGEPTDWEKVLTMKVKVMEPVEEAPGITIEQFAERHVKPAADRLEVEILDEAFDDLRRSELRGNFADLIHSIEQQFRSGRQLSHRQKQVVLEAAEKERSRR